MGLLTYIHLDIYRSVIIRIKNLNRNYEGNTENNIRMS